MNPKFNAFSQFLTSSRTRRGALASLVAFAVGVTSFGEDADARKKKRKKKCNKKCKCRKRGNCGTSCVSQTCQELGLQCGNEVPDNCGKYIDCGKPPGCFYCELTDGTCHDSPPCQPRIPDRETCEIFGFFCGIRPNGCPGETFDCGSCPSGQVCEDQPSFSCVPA